MERLRFPAAADRVICWASDELFDHLSLELPRGGYEAACGWVGETDETGNSYQQLDIWNVAQQQHHQQQQQQQQSSLMVF